MRTGIHRAGKRLMSIQTADTQPALKSDGTWAKLDKLRVGRFGEYFAKMAFVRAGYDVFVPEVDDRAIDMVLRVEGTPVRYFDIQVKTIRLTSRSYVFMRKLHFTIAPNRLLALVILQDEHEPEVFVIPSSVWDKPERPFSSRDFGGGLKSEPEYGLDIAAANFASLDQYRFAGRLPL